MTPKTVENNLNPINRAQVERRIQAQHSLFKVN